MLHIEPNEPKITKTFRLPESLVEKLGTVAAQKNMSLNQVVIQCLSYAIEHIDDSE